MVDVGIFVSLGAGTETTTADRHEWEARMVPPNEVTWVAAPVGTVTGADWRIQTPPTRVPIAAVPTR